MSYQTSSEKRIKQCLTPPNLCRSLKKTKFPTQNQIKNIPRASYRPLLNLPIVQVLSFCLFPWLQLEVLVKNVADWVFWYAQGGPIFRNEFFRLLGFCWILPLIFRLLAGVRAVLGLPLLGLSSKFPVSRNLLITARAVLGGIFNNSPIFSPLFPCWNKRIIAGLNAAILKTKIYTWKKEFQIKFCSIKLSAGTF